MKHVKKFENHNSLEGFDLDILKRANQIIRSYADGNMSYIFNVLNEADVDYYGWNDIEVIIYYLENFDEDND
jgi:hypothetical protein